MEVDTNAGDGPSPGDTVHVVGHGPAVLMEVQAAHGQEQRYMVQYPNGTRQLTRRGEILVHEASRTSAGGAALVGSPRGPRPLLYLGRSFDDPGRNITTSSATFSLIATMVGGGVLSLPYAVSQSGLAFGSLALLLSACASCWTLEMLIECARSTGRDTFELVGHAAYGEASRKCTLGILFVICWLSMIAYFVLIGDLLQPTAELVAPALQQWSNAEAVRRLVVSLAALALSPMCFKGNLAALRFLCFASVGAVLLVSCVVTLRAAEHLGLPHTVQVVLANGQSRQVVVPAEFRWWPADWWKALYVFPMFGVSFLCHFNALPTHHELQRPTQFRMRRVLVLTMSFTSLLYLCVGIFGYMYGGQCTCGNILLNFEVADKLVAAGRAALGLVLMLNFPLICQPCRNALFRVISATSCCEKPSSELPANDECALGDLPASSQPTNQAQHATTRMPLSISGDARVHVYREDAVGNPRRGSAVEAFDSFAPKDETVRQSAAEPTRRQRCGLTVVLLVSSLMVSFFMKSIMVVWSIVGSTVAFLVAFILPSLFWYRLIGQAPTTSALKRNSALVLLAVSIVLAIACTVLTCLNLSAPPCPVSAIPGTTE